MSHPLDDYPLDDPYEILPGFAAPKPDAWERLDAALLAAYDEALEQCRSPAAAGDVLARHIAGVLDGVDVEYSR